MDFERLNTLVSEHGVPSTNERIIEIMREARGIDVTRIVNPMLSTNTHTELARFEDHQLLERSYREYRASRRFSAPVWQCTILGIHFVGRNSSPKGPFASNVGYPSRQIRSNLHRDGVTQTPCPIVIDSNNRVDLSPTMIGSQDHIRIQHVIQSRSMDWSRSLIDGTNFRYPLMRVARTWDNNDNLERELIANGWEVLYVEGHPIGAVLPESVDPIGRHGITFNQPMNDYNMPINAIRLVLAKLKDRWGVETDASDEPTEQDINDVRMLQLAMSINNQVNERSRELRELIDDNRTRINDYSAGIATCMRTIQNNAAELEALSASSDERVINQINAMTGLADRVRGIRAVEDAEIEVDGTSVILKFTTHRFGMGWNGQGPVEIPKLEYRVDLNAQSYSRGIKISLAEDPRLRSTDGMRYGYAHPHLSGYYASYEKNPLTVCWGEAGREPIPDAWARRDWMTLTRLMLGWHTQYNNESPYVHFEALVADLKAAPRTGWLVEEDLAEQSGDTQVEEGSASREASFRPDRSADTFEGVAVATGASSTTENPGDIPF